MPYLTRKYILVYTFFQTIMFGILTFWGVFHPHQSALTFVGDGAGIKVSRCHVAMFDGEVTTELIGKTDEVAAVATLLVADKDKVPH